MHRYSTIVYSGFSHFCFWQCSDNKLTGNFPVQLAPPIIFFTFGRGASPASAGPSCPEGPAADEGAGLLGLGSLSEFEKTMKLSSPVVVAGEGFFAPWPLPGLGPFDCGFLTIFGHYQIMMMLLHVA